MTANSIEERQNNYLVIMDFFSKESSDEYKDYFKTLYPDGVTHGRWAQDSVGDFATCCQTWIGNESSFFCCHFLASSTADVEKQITSWGIDKLSSFIVVEVERFTSSLMPKTEMIKLDDWYKESK